MNVCKQCERNHHLRCTGCDCVLCPIYNRAPIARMTPRVNLDSFQTTIPSRKNAGGGGSRSGAGRPRIPIDPVVQTLIIDGLVNGVSMSAMAREHGISRDRIRTLKQDLEKLATVPS